MNKPSAANDPVADMGWQYHVEPERCKNTRVPNGKVRCEREIDHSTTTVDHVGRDVMGRYYFWSRKEPK